MVIVIGAVTVITIDKTYILLINKSYNLFNANLNEFY